MKALVWQLSSCTAQQKLLAKAGICGTRAETDRTMTETGTRPTQSLKAVLKLLELWNSHGVLGEPDQSP